jgi:hypothetical protein
MLYWSLFMKVIIIKCSISGWWYRNKIGKIYNVENYSNSEYAVSNLIDGRGCFILKKDCLTWNEWKAFKEGLKGKKI